MPLNEMVAGMEALVAAFTTASTASTLLRVARTVALAAVLVVDLGGLAGDNQAGTTAPQAASERNGEYLAPTDSAAAPSAEGAQTPAAGSDTGTPSKTSEAQPATDTDGGGFDALTAAEIALGVTLGLLVVGGLALTFTGRKT